MFRIGILGSDNSHALAFAKLCNLCDANGNYEYDDVRITAIYGFNDSPEHTQEVAREGNIPFIAKSPEEFYDKVDAVMVVYRDGKYHLPAILPFIEKGYPVWIDKPIVTSIEDAEILKKALEENNTLFTGGSTMKYNYEVLGLKSRIASGNLGDITAGFLNFPANLKSEYSGIFFYASHLCEMCLSIFGYDAKSVETSVLADNNFNVIVSYDTKQVVLNFNEKTGGKLHGVVLGSEGSATTEFDLSVIYKLGFDQFVKMLRTKKIPLSFDELIKPVYMMTAIDKSIKENRKVDI